MKALLATTAVLALLFGFGIGWAFSPPLAGSHETFERCDIKDVFLTWTTPGAYTNETFPDAGIDVSGAQPISLSSQRSFEVEDADPWGAFHANVTWHGLLWEDHTGQSIRMHNIGGKISVSAYLESDQQHRLTSFLQVVTSLDGSQLEALSDSVWAAKEDYGRDSMGRFLHNRYLRDVAPVDMQSAVALLDLQVVPYDVGHWQAVGGGYTLDIAVPIRAVEYAGQMLRVDAGDRMQGGHVLVGETDTLVTATTALEDATGLAIEAPRLKADVFCYDIDSTWLL